MGDELDRGGSVDHDKAIKVLRELAAAAKAFGS
jgi:hypothetical protein